MEWMKAIIVFIAVYAVLTFGYLMYRYFFSVIHSVIELSHHVKKKKTIFTPKVSIIIPCYNEEPQDLEKCIVSAVIILTQIKRL